MVNPPLLVLSATLPAVARMPFASLAVGAEVGHAGRAVAVAPGPAQAVRPTTRASARYGRGTAAVIGPDQGRAGEHRRLASFRRRGECRGIPSARRPVPRHAARRRGG